MIGPDGLYGDSDLKCSQLFRWNSETGRVGDAAVRRLENRRGLIRSVPLADDRSPAGIADAQVNRQLSLHREVNGKSVSRPLNEIKLYDGLEFINQSGYLSFDLT